MSSTAWFSTVPPVCTCNSEIPSSASGGGSAGISGGAVTGCSHGKIFPPWGTGCNECHLEADKTCQHETTIEVCKNCKAEWIWEGDGDMPPPMQKSEKPYATPNVEEFCSCGTNDGLAGCHTCHKRYKGAISPLGATSVEAKEIKLYNAMKCELCKGECKGHEIDQAPFKKDWGSEIGSILADFEEDHDEVKATKNIFQAIQDSIEDTIIDQQKLGTETANEMVKEALLAEKLRLREVIKRKKIDEINGKELTHRWKGYNEGLEDILKLI